MIRNMKEDQYNLYKKTKKQSLIAKLVNAQLVKQQQSLKKLKETNMALMNAE
jgi:hypothetical protein